MSTVGTTGVLQVLPFLIEDLGQICHSQNLAGAQGHLQRNSASVRTEGPEPQPGSVFLFPRRAERRSRAQTLYEPAPRKHASETDFVLREERAASYTRTSQHGPPVPSHSPRGTLCLRDLHPPDGSQTSVNLNYGPWQRFLIH